jgi:hypothetical protein
LYRFMGPSERTLWDRYRAQQSLCIAIAESLSHRVGPAERELIRQLDIAEGTLAVLEMDLVEARLLRQLPQFADIIRPAFNPTETQPDYSDVRVEPEETAGAG